MPDKSSPTLPENPNQFTINQHVFPRSAIARFSGSDGQVEIQSLRSTRPKRKAPTAEVFCARRAWDQSTETWRTSVCETRYHALSENIASGRVRHLSAADDQVATEFFALWAARHRARKNPTGDVVMNGLLPDPPITDEQAENLEANGYAFARGNVMPSHILTSIRMRVQMDRSSRQLQGVHWGIVHASFGEFIVPDNNDGFSAIPVTPTICLVAGAADMDASPFDVASINFAGIKSAHEYYFARDLDRCPILRRTMVWEIGLHDI